MGKCCSAKYICGLTEFIEAVVGGGGGGTPGAPVNSVQYNSAGAFAGNANLTYDGTSLKVIGQIQCSTIAATGAVSGTKFTASSTVTTSNPAIDAAQTWNAVGVAFTGIKFNASGDATSAAGSKLLDLQLEAASKFVVDKAGNTSITPAWSGTGTATTPLLVNVTADPGPANAASKLFDLQVGGVTRNFFRKDGSLFFGFNGNTANSYISTNGSYTNSLLFGENNVTDLFAGGPIILNSSPLGFAGGLSTPVLIYISPATPPTP